MNKPGNRRWGISIINLSLDSDHSKLPHVLTWGRDLQESWYLEDCNKYYFWSFRGVRNTSLIEANLKVLTRWYLVPTRLAKIFTSPQYFKGCDIPGSMIHVWWGCSRIRGFGNKIFYLIRKDTGCRVYKSPSVALLNFPVPNVWKSTQTSGS